MWNENATTGAIATVEHTQTPEESWHEQVSNATMLMNVGFQIINLCVFFFIFWKLFGKNIIQSVEDREELLSNIKNAESKYEELINSGQEKFNELIKEWSEQKAKIIEESTIIANKKSNEIIEQAEKKSNQIIEQAHIQASTIESDLIKHHEDMVKKTAWNYLKKIFYQDEALQKTYLDKITDGKLD